MKAILLENIRSAHNVGSMFRTADGAGVSKVFLAGYTARPIDRFGRVQPEIKKTSLGASASLAWEVVIDTGAFLHEQKCAGVTIVVLEQTPESIMLKDFTPPDNVLYVVGNEVTGVSAVALAAADVVVELPMAGLKESLNVGVAAGILLYHDRT